MNDIILGFLIYAVLFRLAVIAAGSASIILGYKLFVRGVMGGEKGTNINAQAGQIKLTLANAGPGLGFALFGAFIIGIMVIQSNPELFLKKGVNQLDDPSSKESLLEEKANQPSPPAYAYRSREESDIELQVRSGKDREEVSLDEEWSDLAKPNLTLSEAAEPLSKIARVWLQENRIGEAMAMARLAARYGPEEDKSNYLALLSEISFKNGDEQEAVSAMQDAANLDPLYRRELARMQERLGQKTE